MAHTVETLSKLLKKTADEVIAILANAGVEGKKPDSEILAEERKILMASLTKRSNKLSTTTAHKANKNTSSDGINILVKPKRIKAVPEPVVEEVIQPPADEPKNEPEQQDTTDNEPVATAAETTPTEPQKPAEKQQQPAKAAAADKKSKKFRNANDTKRKQLHVAHKTTKRKLKKKEQTQISQKIREQQTQHAFIKPVERVIHEIKIPDTISIFDLAQKMTTKAGEVIKVLMSMGVMATLNDVIDQDTALLVVEEMGHKGVVSKQETIEDSLLLKDEKPSKTSPRPPVVTIMGHVDHGKTSLLDCIRKTKITANEAGGITQHIGAYQVKTKHNVITFIDTPGHAAFAKMRSRGANITDIVILVIAADDGVMPQTIESIKYAKAANVPIIVAINKMDKEGAVIDKSKKMLSTYDVVAEDWGGEVMMIPVSAHTGDGIEALLDAVSLTAEVLELSAATDGLASGVVLEARLDKGRGKVTTVLVQSGTLKKDDIVIAGLEYGKIKQIVNDSGQSISKATPSMPVEILGLSGVPDAGVKVLAVDNERKAREVADFRKSKNREGMMQKQQAMKMNNFLSKMEEGDISTVNILIKSDVKGSAQALVEALEELSTDEVKVNIIASGVGAINNTDVNLASASGAIVLGFNVRADALARKTADTEAVRIEYYSIIYNLIDDVKGIVSGLLSPELSENIIGIATVKEVFSTQKLGDIAGCMVDEGTVKRDSPIRVLRDNVVIYEGELESLRRFKDDVKEVKSGTECGIGVKDYLDVKAADKIEVFERIERKRQL